MEKTFVYRVLFLFCKLNWGEFKKGVPLACIVRIVECLHLSNVINKQLRNILFVCEPER